MNDLVKYSNPEVVKENMKKYFRNNNIPLYISTNPKKKYMLRVPMTNKFVHFGEMGFSDFTKHQDINRRNRYLARATKIRGNWKNDPYSPNNLSLALLWGA